MTVVHWRPPDPVADIHAVAWRAGAPHPLSVRVRPELLARLDGLGGCYSPEMLLALPLVVDALLPRFPGFEVHRVPPEPRLGRALDGDQ